MDFESVNKKIIYQSRWLHLQLKLLNNLTVSKYFRCFLMNTCPTDNKYIFIVSLFNLLSVIVNNRNLLYVCTVDNMVVL